MTLATKALEAPIEAGPDIEAELHDLQREISAIAKSQATITFSPQGQVLDANDNFLHLLGYTLAEIQGKHHSMFVDPMYRETMEYRGFWEKLASGHFDAGQYKRIGKGGREVWIQASYNPVIGADGRVDRVVKIAADITAEKLAGANSDGQLQAISKSQAVIEFTLDGRVIDANDNFLRTLGYTIDEVRGQPHSLFVDPTYRSSPEYKAFWEKLGRGEYDAGQYKRIAKGGREVWLQASYNPIMDLNGRPAKVVKYATDITVQKTLEFESTFKSAAFAGTSVAMMIVDRDLKVLYVNDSSKRLFAENASSFRSVWPDFKPEQIVGSCIDMFHKNPSHQRGILADPSRLPYQADITVAELRFSLNVSAVRDALGNYVGNAMEWANVTDVRRNEGQLDAINRSQAVIEFTLDGRVQSANENFLQAMGYRIEEIRGQHHSMFVDPAYRQSHEYRAFWDKLGRGEYDAGQYKRVAKGGREIWLQASYNPIMDRNGRPFMVVKYATDITAQRRVAERVKEISGVVAAAASEMRATAESMSQSAVEAAQQATAVAAAARVASTNVQTVSAAGEELSASINEIARQVAESTNVTQLAVVETDKTSAAIQTLADAAQKIGNVVTLINNIAGQTKLLALNATIEAARAGDAGKGFAVVASEVKSLSDQTAKATHEISSQVNAMQSATTTSVQAIQEIANTIRRVADIAATIASAVEEQSAATAEISTNVVEAADSTREVSQNIGGVNESVAQTSMASAELLTASGELASQAEKLNAEMDILLT